MILPVKQVIFYALPPFQRSLSKTDSSGDGDDQNYPFPQNIRAASRCQFIDELGRQPYRGIRGKCSNRRTDDCGKQESRCDAIHIFSSQINK